MAGDVPSEWGEIERQARYRVSILTRNDKITKGLQFQVNNNGASGAFELKIATHDSVK